MFKQRIGFVFYSALTATLLCLMAPVSAQDAREIDLISELGAELIADRKAAQAAAIEAEHRRILEEQSKLKAAYQAYLGEARRTAQTLIDARRRVATQAQVDGLRAQARAVIDTVNDATKQRVPNELDKHFAQLEEAIAITPEQLLKASPELSQAFKTLGRGNNLDWVNRTAILYALCTNTDHAKVIAGNVQYREKLNDQEAHAIDECNRRRLILGLNPLAIDYKLVEASRDHSKDMVEHGFFAHESPVPGKTSPWDRAKNFGTTASGENIAAGYGTGHAATMGWWYSPGHLKNMMGGGHRRISVGRHQNHWTQMFGG